MYILRTVAIMIAVKMVMFRQGWVLVWVEALPVCDSLLLDRVLLFLQLEAPIVFGMAYKLTWGLAYVIHLVWLCCVAHSSAWLSDHPGDQKVYCGESVVYDPKYNIVICEDINTFYL